MSEQLWFTWNTWGYSGSKGFQICAASPGLLTPQGILVEETNTYLKYVNYQLPPDKVDAEVVDTRRAPLCLAFLWTGKEHILIQRAHTQRVGASYEASCFSHLIAKLPSVQLDQSRRLIGFSAREAIRFWRSDFWQTSVDRIPLGEMVLPRATFAGAEYVDAPPQASVVPEALPDIASGGQPLQQLLLQLVDPQDMLFVIQAFLRLPQEQQIYIAAPSETVAAMIWGLANVLPRTLRAMGNLSFSTYEHDILARPVFAASISDERILPTIVGTCWFYEPGDFPDDFYQNRQSFALNVYRKRHTILAPDPDLDAFAQFALDCLYSQHQRSLADLYSLLDYVEEESKQTIEWPDFFRFYAAYQAPLTRQQIMEALTLLQQEIEQLLRGQQPATTAIGQMKFVNFQHWFIRWISEKHSWWNNSCAVLVESLNQFVDRDLSEDFRQSLQPLVALNPAIEQKLLVLQRDVKAILKTLAEEAFRRVAIGLQTQGTQGSEVLFWSQVFSVCVPAIGEASHWAELFGQLHLIAFSPAYQEWWTGYAQKYIKKIKDYVMRHPESSLASSLHAYLDQAARQCLGAFKTEQHTELFFWSNVLQEVATPVEQWPNPWRIIVEGLAIAVYNPAYQIWWNKYKDFIASINTRAELVDSLTVLAEAARRKLYPTLQIFYRASSQNTNEFKFWADVAVTARNPKMQPEQWMNLQCEIWSLFREPAYRLWWQTCGEQILRDICERVKRTSSSLNEATPSRNAARSLEKFERAVSDDLRRLLLDDSQGKSIDPDILLRVIEVFTAIGSVQNRVRMWVALMQQLGASLPARAPASPSWEVRQLLLETWINTPGFEPAQLAAADPWLTLRWSELKKLSTLALPSNWGQILFPYVLSQPLDISEDDAAEILSAYWDMCVKTFQLWAQNPQSWPYARHYFALLAQRPIYVSEALRLLNSLLSTPLSQEVENELLEVVAKVDIPLENLASFLEDDQAGLLKRSQLPPSMFSLIERYLKNFDIASLGRRATSEFLQKLQKHRESDLPHEVHVYVDGWLTLSQFVNRPHFGQELLISVGYRVREMAQLKPDTRNALCDKLLPALVEHVTEEIDIGRVIDNLSAVLIGPENSADPALALLSRMVKGVNERFSEKKPPRVIPYLKVILQETHTRALAQRERSAKMEEFQTRRFDELLHGVDEELLQRIDLNAQEWTLRERWMSYREQCRLRVWEPYRALLTGGGTVEDLAATFKICAQRAGANDNSLSRQEQVIGQLAQQLLNFAQPGSEKEFLACYKQLCEQLVRQYPLIRLSPSLAQHLERARTTPQAQAEAAQKKRSWFSRARSEEKGKARAEEKRKGKGKKGEPQAIPMPDPDRAATPAALASVSTPAPSGPASSRKSSVIVIVLKKKITWEQIEILSKIIRLYIPYRIAHLERVDTRTDQERQQRQEEIDELRVQLEDLTKAAINDWIDEVILEDWSDPAFEAKLKGEIPDHIQKFQAYLLQNDPDWLQREQLAWQNLATAITIFRRRRLYAVRYHAGSARALTERLILERRNKKTVKYQ